jgi:hypothetical protein
MGSRNATRLHFFTVIHQKTTPEYRRMPLSTDHRQHGDYLILPSLDSPDPIMVTPVLRAVADGRW